MLAALPIPPADRPVGRTASPPPAPGPNFAALLQRGQATHGVLARPVAPPPLHAEAPQRNTIDRDSDDEAPTEAQRAARAAAARAGAKPAQPRDKAAPAAPEKAASPAASSARAAGGEESAVRHPANDAADDAAIGAVQSADLRDWLASLKLQQPPAAELAVEGLAGSPDGAASLGGGSGAANTLGAGRDAGASEDSPSKGSARIAIPGGARSAAQAPEPASGAPAEHRAESRDTATARDATPTLLGGASGAVPRGFDPATLAPIALPAPLYSPEFAQVLGAQVSVFARDGVQQAELHLNPAEMGPISVQIEIDGEQARVDFSADTALTREIIERGLPELASALREQGLTLSGGGVFQRAPEQREQGHERLAAGRSKRVDSAAGAAPARPTAWPAARGLLDLYA